MRFADNILHIVVRCSCGEMFIPDAKESAELMELGVEIGVDLRGIQNAAGEDMGALALLAGTVMSSSFMHVAKNPTHVLTTRIER